MGNPILVEEKHEISARNESIAQKQFELTKDEIVEPKFESNLMEFDINKFGAPPPRARLTKEEQDKIERRKAEKIRLQEIKEQSKQKAKDSFSRNKSFSPSPAVSEKSSILQQSPDNTGSDGKPPPPQKYELPDISQFQPPPPVQPRQQEVVPPPSPLRGGMQQSPVSEQPTPTKFELPDISKFQPPPPVQPRTADQLQQMPPTPVAQTPSFPPILPSRTSTSSSIISSNQGGSIPMNQVESYERSPHPLPKKAPPPKPKKLSDDQLESIVAKKKAPPPPPGKKNSTAAVVDSSASGAHIRELQGKLGNLNLH